MVGLDTDLSQIKERIFEHNKALQIIPITGMGGIGKTTLAKNVYEDPSIVAHFDVRYWVTVSQEPNVEKILKQILGDAKDTKKSVGSLILGVHQKLSGRRFLIVVDDIWSVEAWDSIKNAFQDGNKGSRVVITTRLTEVATKVGSSSPLHEMQLLNEVQSWELFQKEAFGQHERCPPQLEDTGITITNNCKGLPLAIVVIARLLKINRTQEYWGKFGRKINDATETHDNPLMQILSLSYDNLPPHLKACFLYMSLFPEDADIPMQRLKWLWVAEGFLKPAKDKSMEEVAEKCLLDLIDRNLISVRKRSSNGSIRFCNVHDLLRDLSIRKSQEEKFYQQIITPNMGVHRRCAKFCTPTILRFFGVNKTKYGYIYSLICDSEINYQDLLSTMRSKVVKVAHVLEKPLWGAVSFGVNLRYLAFFLHTDYEEFNSSLAKICELKNLETLIIQHYSLPGRILLFPILELPKLKHFILSYRFRSYCLIDNHNRNNCASNKSLLTTLSGVLDFEFTTNAVDVLSNLLKLKIQYDGDIINRVGLNNLAHLHKLETLYLGQVGGGTYLPRNIAFPDKLKKITLWKIVISWENMSAMGSLPNLQVLKMKLCWTESDEWESVEGDFQQLKYLKLDVENLKEWNVESIHFPCLEQLLILLDIEVPSELGEIESLQILTVPDIDRPRLSALKIQEEQQRYGNDQLQVHIIPKNSYV